MAPTTRRTLAKSVLAVFGTAANAHMIMKTPAPYGGQYLDNSPLSSSGANYPCKLAGDAATFYSGVTPTEMAVGESQTLSFTGSAVHGGGSCQLAITSDAQPSASTNWQVILSIESGCPSTDGTAASTYNFTIPDGIASGDYVFAWTWVSKLSGTQEYYMNCAPITVTGGSAKRSDYGSMDLMGRDTSFPDLFVANLESVNSCKTVLSSDVKYPDPGTNVETLGASPSLAAPSGSNCFPSGSTGSSSGSDSGSGSSAGSSDSSSSASAAVPSTSTAAAEEATTSVTASGFLTSTTSAAEAATTTEVAATTAAGAQSSSPSVTSSSAAAGSTGTSGSGSTSSSSGGMSGTCTEEGTFYCVGGSEYQQCASGAWTELRAMPAGTVCSEGESTSLWGRGSQKRSRKVRRRI
ncbi:hypothetical protein BX600DRAFT_437892 [Xylariales sp. PMI_506]|nr:hypothetical protein BX600DRAFT_437892 [Xylariales sp. PMI_506]